MIRQFWLAASGAALLAVSVPLARAEDDPRRPDAREALHRLYGLTAQTEKQTTAQPELIPAPEECSRPELLPMPTPCIQTPLETHGFWQVTVDRTSAYPRLQIEDGNGVTIVSDRISLKLSGDRVVDLEAGRKQLRISCSTFHVTADSLTVNDGPQLILDGAVRFHGFKKGILSRLVFDHLVIGELNRTEQLIPDSKNLRYMESEISRFWMNDQPSHLTKDRIDGGISP